MFSAISWSICISGSARCGGQMGADMKVIFLDFDGVLNSVSYCRRHPEPGIRIDPTRMELLHRIVDKTGAAIVLSTSWKEHWDADPAGCDTVGEDINRIFLQHGMRIFDKIPNAERGRGANIAAWLSGHREVTRFVALDDMPMDEDVLKDRCVLTSRLRDGLDEEDAERAVKILTD